MKGLSKAVRFAPKLFYAAAVVLLLLNIALPVHELTRYGHSTTLPGYEGQLRVAIVQLIIQQVADALYLLANGLILQVLIAIWDRLGSGRVAEVAE